MLALRKIPIHLLVAASAWAGRVVGASVQIFSIRFLMKNLGADHYSTFALLTALLSWLMLIDFGLGNSLQNHISERRAKNKNSQALIMAACFSMLGFVILTTFLLALFSGAISSSYLKSVTFLNTDGKTEILLITGLIFALTAAGNIPFKIWFAQGKGWLANIIPTLGAACGMIMLTTSGMSDHNHDLSHAIVYFYTPNAIISVGCLLYIWRQNKTRIRRPVFLTAWRMLLSRSWEFWLFSVLATLVLQSDYIVMSQQQDTKAIAMYAMLQKFFGLAFFVYSALLQAMWPRCAELHATENWQEMHKMSVRYIKIGMAGMLAFTLLFLLMQPFIMHLLSSTLLADSSTILLFGGYFLLRIWCDTYAMLLQSMSKIKALWLIVPLQAAISLGLQWLLAPALQINGILLGLMLSFLFTSAIVNPLTFHRFMRNTLRHS